jgi:hypothetical protein
VGVGVGVGLRDDVRGHHQFALLQRARTWSASGRLTSGLVAMTHTALMRPSSMARNRSTAFRPGLSAMRGIARSLHDVAMQRLVQVHVRGQHVGQAADFAPAHGIGLAGDGERPHAGLADAAGGQVAVDDAVDLVGAGRRLVHAHREAGDDLRVAAKAS